MPSSPAEDQPSREDPGNAIPPEGADEQDQHGPTAYREKTFLEHLEDAMNEHAELGRLLAK